MLKGFLLVLMEPPPSFEREFNDWYETEHPPERLAVPGFESGLRYLSVENPRRYLAVYDLTSANVLQSERYLSVSLNNSTSWTKRVASKVRAYRASGDQIYPGHLNTDPSSEILLLRFRALDSSQQTRITAGIKANFELRSEVTKLRVFAYATPSGIDYIALVETKSPTPQILDPSLFAGCDRALDLIEAFAPYRSRLAS
jgi:hypothetical protein